MVGRTIAHYRILEKLGAGGMGEVFKAEDLTLGRLVALKFLPPSMASDRLAAERLRREARAASILNHPGICTIHAIEEQDGQQFIAMELLDGQPLASLIATGPLPLGTLLPMAIQIAEALEAAHSHGIVHRDIKPANIFITKRQQAKILDFGVVKVTGTSVARDDVDGVTLGTEALTTTPGMTVGTIAYMSPEQARGEALDARTDLFSFGLVLYEMATGRRAFGGGTTAVVFDAILNRMPPPVADVNRSVPAELDRIIGKALEKERHLRYQTALDLGADLQRLRRDTESSARLAVSPSTASASATSTISGQNPDAGLHNSSLTAGGMAPSGLIADQASSGSAPLAHVAPTPSGMVAAAPGMSKAVLLGGGIVIIALIAVVAYLGGRIQERVAAPAPVQAGAPASTPLVAVEAEPDATTAPPVSAATPAASGIPKAPIAASPADATTRKAEDDRVAAKAAEAMVATEFEDIRNTLAAKRYAQATVALNSFVGQYPTHQLTPDAYLLLGQTYEASNRDNDAAAAYNTVVEKFRKSPRAAEALFRQAQLVLRSRQPQREPTARKLLTQAAEEYPASEWAPRALVQRAQIEERVRERVLDVAAGGQVPVVLLTYRTLADRYLVHAEDALWKMSEIFADLDRHPLQAQTLTELTTRYPETRYDAYWKLGEVLERRLKDKERAIEAYASVPTTSPKYREAQRKLQELKR